ncbi:MAG: hypothetical protein HQM10_05205 [Candidatus Riflebacteria bacterium]|nr:hypothetical protein [Candidatus Riflebacteria bacterium]
MIHSIAFLENQKKELHSMCHITSSTPVVLGGALVVPIGYLNRQKILLKALINTERL